LAKQHFLLLFPDLFGFKGGMQVYSAFLLQGLQTLEPQATYQVVLRCDRSNAENLRNLQFLPHTQFTYFGEPPIEHNRWNRWKQYCLGAIRLANLAIQQRPTLAIATDLNTYIVIFNWLQRVLGVPYWVVLHGLEAWDVQNSAHIKALQQAERVLMVSQHTHDRILSQGYLDPAKVTILPNTFDASEFQIQPKPDYLLKRYHLTSDQPVIFTVTRIQRFAKYKGYDKILQALPKIRQHLPNVRYILAGKGDDRSRVEAMIENLGLQDCVTLAGFIPEHELGDHYNLCDVFAMPSKSEGFGIVYLEALACGKPVLAGNQDGASDPLVQGKLGCMVDPDDVNAIANNLIQILQGTYRNPLLYQPEQLRQETIRRFEFAQFCQTLQRLLQVRN
jgi:glycosyltransferase involved in cell wall biosynthesis